MNDHFGSKTLPVAAEQDVAFGTSTSILREVVF